MVLEISATLFVPLLQETSPRICRDSSLSQRGAEAASKSVSLRFVVLQGNVTFSCSQPQLVACTFLSSSSSFLSLPSAASATGGFSVRFQFRTWNPDGLLLSVQLNPEPQRLELQISNSRLYLTLHNSVRQKSEVSAGESTGLTYTQKSHMKTGIE